MFCNCFVTLGKVTELKIKTTKTKFPLMIFRHSLYLKILGIDPSSGC